MKTETITLYVSEILFDVKNKAHLTGRSRNNPDAPELAANMQASDDDDETLLRSVGNAFAALKTTLAEYIESSDTSADNLLLDDDTSTLTLSLKVPSNYNSATISTISSAAHQYISNVVLADWFNITDKADSDGYKTLAAANLSVINEAINKRVRPTREAPKQS